MKPEKFRITRKVASWLLFASLILASLSYSPVSVQAQIAEPQQLPAASLQSDDIPASWSLDYDIRVPETQFAALGAQKAEAQVENMLASKNLKQKGLTYKLQKTSDKRFKFNSSGKGHVAQLRSLLFSELAPEMDLLEGPVALDIHVKVKNGQALPLTLETRPATGYAWEISQADTSGVMQNDLPIVKAEVERPSAPAKSTFQLKGTMDGDATIQMIYRRAWDSGMPVRHVSVTLDQMPESLDLSSPLQPQASAAPQLDAPMVGEPVVSLPTHFDWRDQGKVPPVRDQGGCGSCWAFGTVGAMESAMMVQGGLSAPNLSEQYLISCNKEGWGCNGGWWAHDYHTSVAGASQTSAGAVLESDKPYSATNGSCTANYNKPYKLTSWGYVSGAYNSVPSVDQLKNAIYTYGAVSAAVCTGTGWNTYKSGQIFSTNETSQCGGSGQVNHAILLVGWDDAGQYWILRNSWGSNWGENGYMRIKWGTSNVGYGATYVVYKAANPTPAPTTPPQPTPTSPVPTTPPQPTPTRPVPTTPPQPTPTRPAPTSAPTSVPTNQPSPVPSAPVNDSVNNAKVISHSGGSLSYQDLLNTTGATVDASDPYFPFTTKRQGYHTVWYRFTPVWTGKLSINTLTSNYDTILGVWTRDAQGVYKLVKWNDNTSTRKQSSLSFTSGIGVTYYIEVASKTATAGTMNFKLSYTPSLPANNRISSAKVISDAGLGKATNSTLVLDVARATTTTDEPVLQGDPRGRGYRTVWMKFTPTQNGMITATTSGSNYNTILGAWKYANSKWTWIGMNDDWDGQQSGFQLNGVKGTRYLIGVISNDPSGPSKMQFNFNFQP